MRHFPTWADVALPTWLQAVGRCRLSECWVGGYTVEVSYKFICWGALGGGECYFEAGLLQCSFILELMLMPDFAPCQSLAAFPKLLSVCSLGRALGGDAKCATSSDLMPLQHMCPSTAFSSNPCHCHFLALS